MTGPIPKSFDLIYLNNDPYHKGGDAGLWWASVATAHRGPDFAWGWGAVGVGLVYMFKATGDTKYLDWMLPQIEWVITHRDIDLNIESYDGTSIKLPAWNDGGLYGSVHTYPVHTAVICIPILLFIAVVWQCKLTKYVQHLPRYLTVCGAALSAHNTPENWQDFSPCTGFPVEPNYGDIAEAGKITMPNRGNAYLAACALYDKLCGSAIYASKVIKGFNYFRTCFRLDPTTNSYYWSYWPFYYGDSGWEDIGHAALTLLAFWLVHWEAGLTLYSSSDFQRVANTAGRIVDLPNKSIRLHDNIAPNSPIHNINVSPYASAIGSWSLPALYDPSLLVKINLAVEALLALAIQGKILVIGDVIKSVGLSIYVNSFLGKKIGRLTRPKKNGGKSEKEETILPHL